MGAKVNPLVDVRIQRAGTGAYQDYNGTSAGTRGLAYATALAAATSGDQLYVGPGTLIPAGRMLKNGVNVHFAGTQIQIPNEAAFSIFGDNGAAVVARVTGAAEITQTGDSGFHPIDIAHALSDVSIGCRALPSPATCGTMQHTGGKVNLRCEYITGGGYGLWWKDGDFQGQVDTISVSGIALYGSVVASNPTGQFWFRGNNVIGLEGAEFAGTDNARVWIDAHYIRRCIFIGGRNYLFAKKVEGVAAIGISLQGGQLWGNIQKLTGNGSTEPLALVDGQSWLTIGEFENLSTPARLIKVSAGTHFLDVQDATNASGDGAEVTGGTLTVFGNFDTNGTDLVQSDTGAINASGSGSGTGGAFTTSGTVTFPVASPTAILEAVKTVDGVDSGLDADTLDGLDATAFDVAGAATAVQSNLTTHAALTQAHGISAFGATLVDDASASAARTTLGVTAFGDTLITAANAAAGRTALGLATVASSGSAADLGSGTLPDARLSSNVPLKDAASNAFATATGTVTIAPGSSTPFSVSGNNPAFVYNNTATGSPSFPQFVLRHQNADRAYWYWDEANAKLIFFATGSSSTGTLDFRGGGGTGFVVAANGDVAFANSATGTFTSQDGKTVTVSAGRVVSIV